MCISSEGRDGVIDNTAVVEHFLCPATVSTKKERFVHIFGILLALDLMKGFLGMRHAAISETYNYCGIHSW